MSATRAGHAAVSEVTVDLAAHAVTVVAEPLDETAVRAAIEEAGYTVVG